MENIELPPEETVPFRVSSGLKDLIGRDLITDDFVAIFELVKNSFDAHATDVTIRFLDDLIVIEDNGKGMSKDDILEKWLFVAYSAKSDGSEDEGYRDLIEERQRPFAGAKGVGRFSCDRLGRHLHLVTSTGGSSYQNLKVDWTKYERDHKEEFTDIFLSLFETFPSNNIEGQFNSESGTKLLISSLRSEWNRDKILSLKRELGKLIDPFAGSDQSFSIRISAPSELEADAKIDEQNATSDADDQRPKVNGAITNPIIDVLSERTTHISTKLSDDGGHIVSELVDRGTLIYRIKEINPFSLISGSQVRADIYYLNRSAKFVFARRMGLPSVQFGSIFLFRNGFRVFPVGAEDDDFFGLNRRKQQGQRRFLGNRDLIGRVDVKGVPEFNESTSRNQGLIKNDSVEQLIEFVRDKCIKRLERYVVDITWKDTFDKDVENIDRMLLDGNSALVSQLVSKLSATSGIDLLEFSPDIVRIVDEKSEAFEGSLKSLEILAEETGDPQLLRRVDEARDRMRVLRLAEEEAREAERRAVNRAVQAEKAASAAESRYSDEIERNRFLVAAATLDEDTILNLHHQIIIHASDVHNEVQLFMSKLRRGEEVAKDEWVNVLGRISYRNSQILTAAKFATKGGYKQQSSTIVDNLPLYIFDYIEKVSSLWSRKVKVLCEWDQSEFTRSFRPIDVGILIDNLVSNSERAGAGNINFSIRVEKSPASTLVIDVADDGRGWPSTVRPLDRIMEKGVTSTTGSGLGLFHVKEVVEGMKGRIAIRETEYSEQFDGAHMEIRVPK
ncbi:TPA: ATP-binding protein [Stenotrophomonas maltophilia]